MGLLCLLTTLAYPYSDQAKPAPESPYRPHDPLNSAAFERFYNQDYDRALQDFQRVAAKYPDDAFAVNHLLTAVLFRELYRMGALNTGDYANDSFVNAPHHKADPQVKEQIKQLVDRATRLEEQRLEADPKDVDALYARGVTRAQFATYTALIEHAWFSALRNAVGARRDHEKVLELSPEMGSGERHIDTTQRKRQWPSSRDLGISLRACLLQGRQSKRARLVLISPHPSMIKIEDAKLVKGLVPGKKTDTFVLGDLAEARKIAERSLAVVKQFSEAVIRQDIEAAYRLCANELRCWMSVQRFVTELAKADAHYNGKPISYFPERITWIYADEISRKETNKEGDWPKDTPRPNKRALTASSMPSRLATRSGATEKDVSPSTERPSRLA